MSPGAKLSHRDKRGPVSWMARNSVAANLMMALIIAGGVIGLLTVKQEVFPEFDLDIVAVQVPYPGASPSEVEQSLVLAIEEAVRGLDGVKRVLSTASEGSASVSVELLLGANPDKVLADVKNAIDRITTFPEEAEEPTVSLVSRKREVVSLVISGDQPQHTLHATAERARARLLESEHITQVEIFGVLPREIHVEVPRAKLEAYGLSLQQIAAAIRSSALELPGGGLKTDAGELLVRVAERKNRGEQYADIILKGTARGASLRLADIAHIDDSYADVDRASFYDGKPAVRVTAYRVGDETPKQVAAAVRAFAKEFGATLPATLHLAIWNDRSVLLAERTDLLVRNAVMGLILVFGVLALVLELRLAFWVALGIPVSFLGAFFLMPGLDTSVNMITLFAFIITLGMVVDDAIVIGENIYELRQKGLPRLQASIRGAREMVVPVTFSVLTTMAAFAPMLFVPGIMGKIFKYIPIIVLSVLFFSMVESFFVLPAHLGHGRDKAETGLFALTARLQRRVDRFITWSTARLFQPQLRWALRHRITMVSLALSMLIVTIALVASGTVPFNFFPKLEGDVVTASARFPYGSPVQRSEQMRHELEQAARRALQQLGQPEALRGMFSRLGESGVSGGHGGGARKQGSHLVSVELNLVPTDQRRFSSTDLADAWEKQTRMLPGVVSLTYSGSTGPSAGAAVEIQLSHHDNAVLQRAAAELTREMRRFDQLTNVENSFSQGKVQLDFKLKPSARNLGLSSQDVARQIRAAFYGVEAQREQRGRDEIKVMVRLPKTQRQSEYDLARLKIHSAAGADVPLGEVTTFTRSRAPTVIDREQGRRIISVAGELKKGVPSPQQVMATLKTKTLPALRKKYPELITSFAGQHRTRTESMGALGRNFIFALLVIFAMLAIPFKSYVQPIVVMSAIPFGFIGAVAGHMLMGYSLSIVSMMGIIALAGVAVNDALVLVDTANRLRDGGMDAGEAVVQAAMRRMRPILLTSITTFFGLAPMIFETSVQARFLIPMALSLGFGILFATGVSLMLVPVLYLSVERARAWLRGAPEAQAALEAP